MTSTSTLNGFWLRWNGKAFMNDSLSLILIVYNKITGATSLGRTDHQHYLDVMGPALMGGKLTPGDLIELVQHGIVGATFRIGGPKPDELTEAKLFELWLYQVSRECNEDDLPTGQFRPLFRERKSPKEAACTYLASRSGRKQGPSVGAAA